MKTFKGSVPSQMPPPAESMPDEEEKPRTELEDGSTLTVTNEERAASVKEFGIPGPKHPVDLLHPAYAEAQCCGATGYVPKYVLKPECHHPDCRADADFVVASKRGDQFLCGKHYAELTDHPDVEVSKCCTAPVTVGGKGTTHWHECTECGFSCDIVAMTESQVREKKQLRFELARALGAREGVARVGSALIAAAKDAFADFKDDIACELRKQKKMVEFLMARNEEHIEELESRLGHRPDLDPKKDKPC